MHEEESVNWSGETKRKYASASESHWITSSTVWMEHKFHIYGEIILSLETEYFKSKK